MIEVQDVNNLLNTLFEDNPEISYTVFYVNGAPMLDSSDTMPPRANRSNAPEVIQALERDLGRGMNIRENENGTETLYIAVLIQREIEVTGILRLGLLMEPTMQEARRSLWILLGAALLITSGVGLFGWMLANNLSRPIQVLTRAAENMERGDLGVRVDPSGPQEMQRLAMAFNSMAKRLETNVNELRAFVANASHELRTPLTVVKLRTEALSDGALEEPEVAGRFLSEIETEVDRLVRMVNDLLDLSRMEAGMDGDQRTKLNLSTIANDVYETFKIRAAKADVELCMDIEPGLPSMRGMKIKSGVYSTTWSKTPSSTPPVAGRSTCCCLPLPSRTWCDVLVRDNGPGISPDHLPHVFERFYRAEQTSPPGTVRGSGLGLAIAKSIVEAHGGAIGVSSQPGSGTSFWADLPAVKS